MKIAPTEMNRRMKMNDEFRITNGMTARKGPFVICHSSFRHPT